MRDKVAQSILKADELKDMQAMTHSIPHDSKPCLLFVIHMQRLPHSARWLDDTCYTTDELLKE